MSKATPPRPKEYKPGTGSDRYSRFASEWLQVTRTYVLDTILEALDEHNQIVVIGANGVGKSYFVGVGGLAALYTNPHTIVHVTAGTSTTLKNNIWKPTRGIWLDAKENYGIPGRKLDGTREIRTEMGDKWYYECISPKYPDDLEGPHNDNVIYFIEEADKPGVTHEHIDSVRSTVTDESDRVVVIANPPDDESNCVMELVESDEWHTLQFSSWDSHNVRISQGIQNGEEIGGLATEWKIRQDWEEYHDEPWPGLEQAIEWSDPWYGVDEGTHKCLPPKDPPNPNFREDLHSLWYKRRAGIIPPQDSQTWRPFTVSTVRASWARDTHTTRETPEAIGIDVARHSDKTVVSGLRDGEITVLKEWQNTDLTVQTTELIDLIDEFAHRDLEITIDATPMGAQMADALANNFPNVHKFNAGNKAADKSTYRYCWSEGLALLGEYLEGGSIESVDIRRQLLTAARIVEFEETHIDARGGKVIQATPKEQIKQELGTSPDYLDAALMAVWGLKTNGVGGKANSATFSW